MFALFVTLAAVGIAMLIAGGAWMILDRGRTTRRAGPEIAAELMAERKTPGSPSDGSLPLAGWTWSGGRGWAIEGKAEYSMDEIVAGWRSRRLRPILPPLLAMAGLVVGLLFTGLALLTRSGTTRWAGLGVLAFLAYAVYLVASGVRASSPRK